MTRGAALASLLFACGSACSARSGAGEGAPAPRGANGPATLSAASTAKPPGTAAEVAGATPPKLPASKRILGRWAMNLNDVPKEALVKDFQRFKQSKGLADMVKVEYTVTDTDWILRKYGAGGVYEQRWHYQILQEDGDVLALERVGDDGQPQRIEVKVGDDTIVVGTGSGMVPLKRIE